MSNAFSGYVGSWLCDENGVFDPVPTVSFDFPVLLEGTIPGLTLTWSTIYGEWASEFRLTAYHGDRSVFTKTLTNDNISTLIEADIRGYTKLTIEILRWSKPYRRARMEGVVFGIQKVYRKSDIMSYNATMYVNPLSAELPKSEITFEIKNLNGAFNPDNPQGVEKYIMERQRVTVSYGYKLGDMVEWIDGGIFYLSEWETPQNGITATLKARDTFELMTDTYNGPTRGTLYQIAKAALVQANLPSLPNGYSCWFLHPYLERVVVPEDAELRDCSIAEVLQYVANAGCCVLYQNRKGQVRIEPLLRSITDYSIDRFNSYADSELVLTKPLKTVAVNRDRYILPVARNGTTQPIENPLISDKQAPAVAEWAAEFLANRRTVSGAFRADPRLDPLDIVTNVNQFSTSRVVVSEVKFSYKGAFRGSYRGRGVDQLFGKYFHVGELYTGEV